MTSHNIFSSLLKYIKGTQCMYLKFVKMIFLFLSFILSSIFCSHEIKGRTLIKLGREKFLVPIFLFILIGGGMFLWGLSLALSCPGATTTHIALLWQWLTLQLYLISCCGCLYLPGWLLVEEHFKLGYFLIPWWINERREIQYLPCAVFFTFASYTLQFQGLVALSLFN